ncbi:hypothetical protein D1816_07575 [Aquimarina sp. AD10]|nr:hypothetical protein D1816_07575 [Aquimarina sp. AD10]RKM92998.1 hypothetical protein D7033_20495 [Aquimarina sp. AD10]
MFNIKNILVKIKSLLYIIFILVSSLHAQRKTALKTDKEIEGYKLIPQEKVFIHYNSSLIFAGEYLYYSLYCFNTQNNQLSTISTVAYVSLINENNESVFQHKIKLVKGRGQGDFFVPVAIPSGNYKLVGYTQWMLNENSGYFNEDISILNPYQGNQSKVLVENDSLLVSSEQSLVNTNFSSTKKINELKLGVTLDRTTYTRRAPVKLTLECNAFQNNKANVSISIRRKDTFIKSIPQNTIGFSKASIDGSLEKKNISPGTLVFLPEMRGELMYGRILTSDSSLPIALQNVGVSIAGEVSDLKIVTTDEKGRFVFNLHDRNNKNEVRIQVLGENKGKYVIKLDEFPEIKNFTNDFYQFKITTSYKNQIEKRSVHNQIENSFYGVKPDTIQEAFNMNSFYGENIITYNLDDYTRFSTVKETIIEVVEGVWIKKDANGNRVFGVRGNYPEIGAKQMPPLLIVDGIFIQEQDKVIEYDARNVKSISFIRDKYYVGAKVFDGVVIIKSIDETFLKTSKEKVNLAPIQLADLKTEKKYFNQRYDSQEEYSRIPDYRNQLLWQPNVVLNNPKYDINFFTSDVAGQYEISIEGFTNDNQPISIKEYFTVE